MKLKMAFTVLISFMLFFAFQNCSQKPFELNELSSFNPQHIVNEGWSVSSIEPNKSSLKRSDSNVSYFGFYASAYDQDNIDQVKALSNLVHIDHSSGDVNFIISALRKAKENQLAAIVSVQNIFYDCSGWNCEFRDNIESLKKWKLLRDQIKNHGLISTIFSFYTDEPEMYARIREAKAAERGISLKIDVIAELQNIASIIKSDFPNVKLQMTSAAFDVHSNMELPLGFDVFGMDCYNGWESCGPGSNRKSIPDYYKILTNKIQELEGRDGRTRYLALLPPSFYVDDDKAGEMPSKMTTLNLFEKYLSYSKENSKVIAVIPFLWPNHQEGANFLHGASGFPEFISKVENYFGGFQKPNLSCIESTQPSEIEFLSCGSGFTGQAKRTRTVTCSGSTWTTGAWTMDSSGCQAVVCPTNSQPIGLEFLSCGSGFTGQAKRTRTVTCSGSTWTTGAWTMDSSGCQAVQQNLPGPAEPLILNGGVGCDDLKCLWVITSYLTPSYRIFIRDPGNFSKTVDISLNDGLLRSENADGSISISFRIPTIALGVYQDRGLDVILVNQLNGKESMYHRRFSKP